MLAKSGLSVCRLLVCVHSVPVTTELTELSVRGLWPGGNITGMHLCLCRHFLSNSASGGGIFRLQMDHHRGVHCPYAVRPGELVPSPLYDFASVHPAGTGSWPTVDGGRPTRHEARLSVLRTQPEFA